MKSTETHTIVAAQAGCFLVIFDNINSCRCEQSLLGTFKERHRAMAL